MAKKIDYSAMFTDIKYTKKRSSEPLFDEFEVVFYYKNRKMAYFFFPFKSEKKTEEDIKKEFEELIKSGKIKKYVDKYYSHKKVLVPLASLLVSGAIAGASFGTYFALKGNSVPIETYNFDFDGGTTCQIDGSYTKHVDNVEKDTVLNYTIKVVEPTMYQPLTDAKVTIDDKPATKGSDYTFDGNTGAFSITMKGNVKVTANAELITFDVTFHHVPDPESTEEIVETVIPVQAGGFATKDKHDFTGQHLVEYYSDDKFETLFDFEKPILINTNVYVKYLYNEYDVTFYDWDGKVLKETEKCRYGKVPTPPADPSRDPDERYTYEFAGWSPEVGEIKKDTDFIAQYTPTEKVYTLTLDENGGTWIDTEPEPTGGYDTKFGDLIPEDVEDLITPPEGKYLAGWTYTKDDPNTKVDDGDLVFHNVIQPSQSLTVYAYYEKIDYHLTVSIENCQVEGKDEYSDTFNFDDPTHASLSITANEECSVPEKILTDDLEETTEYTYSRSEDNKSATLTFKMNKMPSHDISFTGEGIKRYHIIYDSTTCKNVTITGVSNYYYEGKSATITVTTDQDLYSVPLEVKFLDDDGDEFTDFNYVITDDTDTQKSSRTEATITIDAFPASSLHLSMEARERFFIGYNFGNGVNPDPTTPKPYYHNDSPVIINFASITSGNPVYSVPDLVNVTNATSSYTITSDDKAALTISSFTGEAGTTSTITASGRQRCFVTKIGDGYSITPDKNYYHAGENASIALTAADNWELPENSSTNYIVKVNGTEIESTATIDSSTHKTGNLTFKMPDDSTKVGPISIEVKTIKQYFLDTSGITNLDSSEIDTTTPHYVNDEVTFTIKKTTISDVTYSTPTNSSKYSFTNAEFVEFTSSSDDAVTIKVKVKSASAVDDHSIGVTVSGVARHLITTNLTNLEAQGKADYYHEGDSVSFTLKPTTGYGVPKAITLDPAGSLTYSPSADRTSATLTGTMPAQSIAITAVASKQLAVNLSGSNVTWERVEPTIYSSDEIYYEGDTVKLKVTAADSYILPTALPEGTVKTVTSGTSVATSNYELNESHSEATFTFTMPNDSVNVSLDSSQLTITDASVNCSLTFNSAHYRPGDTITATVTPDDGYNIDNLDLTATVTGTSTSYTATYDKDNHIFTIEDAPNEDLTMSVKIYNVTFNAMGGKWTDGDVIKTTTYNNGATLVVPSDPTREASVTTSYTFNGWNTTPVTTVTSDVTYFAQWTDAPRTYDIKWVYYDASGQLITDTETSKDQPYGSTLTPPDVPSSYQSGIYVYTFVGWDKPVRLVDGNETYTAQYTQGYQTYTVKWLDGDGTTLKTETYDYGETPVVPEGIDEPTLIKDGHEFTWTGEWDGIAPLTGESATVEIKPIFDENVYYEFTGTNCYVGDSQSFIDAHTFGETNVTYTLTAENGYYFDADTTKSEYYSIEFDGVTPAAGKVIWTVSADGSTLTVKINEAMKYNVKLNVKAVQIV